MTSAEIGQSGLEDSSKGLYKDAVLDQLAERANVAQFVSFAPGPVPRLRYSRIRGHSPNEVFGGLEDAVSALQKGSVDHSVNVRSYHPHQPRSNEFVYGLADLSEAVAAVRRLAASGLHTIVNETIDVNDGGVSGVAYGDILEFAPDDTPRCVEKPGTVSIKRQAGLGILETVYGFTPALDYGREERVEFSIHPVRRGHRHEHTIVWELEPVGPSELRAETRWPNHFSRLLGDKTFGLLVAHSLGLPVPHTTVISRALAPFTFGVATTTGEQWIRTCPREQVPGLFTTRHGWTDPFSLLQAEDPGGTAISSILSQDAVESIYSGALLTDADGGVTVEGVAGSGEDFMLGLASPTSLPAQVLQDARDLQARASLDLGPVRMEWVHDGVRAWVVQLHASVAPSRGSVLFPGEASSYRQFPVSEGIEGLRQLIEEVLLTGEGIVLVGSVGVTSHLGDLLRRARVPSRLEPQDS
jgi:hypothetical protein